MKMDTALKLRKKTSIALSALLVCGTLSVGTITASASVSALSSNAETSSIQSKTISIVWNPSYYEFDGVKMMPLSEEQGFWYQDTTYVPLRFVAYGLNKSVGWDQQSKTVTISEPNAQELIAIREYQANAKYRATKDKGNNSPSVGKITVQQVPITYIFDGIGKSPDEALPGLIYKGRIYVPMRFVGEALGYEVNWDKEARAVIMNSPADVENDHAGSGNSPNNSNESGSNEGASDTVTGGVIGGTSSGSAGNVSYADIVTSAERTLRLLEGDAQSKLYTLLNQYSKASTSEEKNRIKAEGQKVFDDTTVQFRNLIAETSKQLTANGHSTAIIQEYEEYYNQRIEFGMSFINMN